jgi:hypothetical protein
MNAATAAGLAVNAETTVHSRRAETRNARVDLDNMDMRILEERLMKNFIMHVDKPEMVKSFDDRTEAAECVRACNWPINVVIKLKKQDTNHWWVWDAYREWVPILPEELVMAKADRAAELDAARALIKAAARLEIPLPDKPTNDADAALRRASARMLRAHALYKIERAEVRWITATIAAHGNIDYPVLGTTGAV